MYMCARDCRVTGRFCTTENPRVTDFFPVFPDRGRPTIDFTHGGSFIYSVNFYLPDLTNISRNTRSKRTGLNRNARSLVVDVNRALVKIREMRNYVPGSAKR